MDRIQATPRVNPTIGGLADLLAASYSPQRTQQLQGLMNFLGVPAVAQTLDRISYGEPITTGRGMTTELRPEAKSTLGALLGLVPIGRAAAPAAEAATMAAGRAGERVASRVVPQVMERGGLPAEMLGAMAQGTQSPATVYHGTPHLFSKFDSSKIGTGEGAQAYGHGLYFAENRGVAEDYARVLASPRNQASAGKGIYIEPSPAGDGTWRIGRPSEMGGQMKGRTGDATQGLTDYRFPTVAAAIKHAKKTGLLPKKGQPLLTEIADEGVYNPVRSAAQMQDQKYNQLIASQPGNLMQVDLPDEQIARMLDWDKPLSQQPKNVQDAIRAYAKELDVPLSVFESGPLGPTVTRAAMEPQLRQAGIPGIRYLDEGSRAAGQGTSNFVVFPGMEDMLRIEQINNQPIESLFQNLGR